MGTLKEKQNLVENNELENKDISLEIEEIEELVQLDEIEEMAEETPKRKEKKGFFSKIFGSKRKERFDFHDEDAMTLEEALGQKSFEEEDELPETENLHKPKKNRPIVQEEKLVYKTEKKEPEVSEVKEVLETEEAPVEKLELDNFDEMKEKAKEALLEKDELSNSSDLEATKVAVLDEVPVDLLHEVVELPEEAFETVELDKIAIGDELLQENEVDLEAPELETEKQREKLFGGRTVRKIEEAPQIEEIAPENLPVPTDEPEEKEVGIIGQGFTSEVYQWDDKRVLKLYREGFDHQICEKEFHTMQQVYSKIGICPKPYEIITVDGRIGGVYEYLDGKTMQKELLTKFWSSNHQAKVLAQVHYEMQTRHDFELITVKDKLCNDIGMLHELTEREKLKLYKVIHELPDGDRLCHFDLHPGNIIYKGGVPVIIDWADACIGDPLADVARTSVLLRYGRSKDQPFYVNLGVKIFQSKMVYQYQKEYLLLSRKNAKDIEQWELPIMAARIGEDIAQEEKELLVHYVKRQLQFKSIH